MSTQYKKQEKPTEQRGFESLGQGIQKFSPGSGKLLNRLFDNWLSPPNQSDWVVDAQWQRIQQDPARARFLLYLILITFIILVIWSAFAPLDEVARGEGKVIPSQKLQVVQSYDGGMVEQILVNEGQTVEKGDVLLKVDSTRFASSLRENQADFQALSARVARLQALTANSKLHFDEALEKAAPQTIINERSLYNSSKRELEQQLFIQKRQIEQRRHELSEASAALQQYSQSLALAERELRVTRPLLQSGAVSDVDIIRLERQAVDLKGEINRSQAVIKRSRAAISEAEDKLEEIKVAAVNKWNDELSEAMRKLRALKETEAGLADRVAQTDIKSPVRGKVQRLLVNTVGGILQPGSDILEIIPLDDQLVIEAKIHPRDIAFLRPGLPAMVKFTAYDFAIYGGLEAEVMHISADTITDEKDNTYYLVQLKTKHNTIADDLTIIPGMVTQVDIITGKKTVLEYLLKPILRATSVAMTER